MCKQAVLLYFEVPKAAHAKINVVLNIIIKIKDILTFSRCVLLTSHGLCNMFFKEGLALDHASEETKSHDEKVTGKLTVVLLLVILVYGINQKLQHRER